MPLPLIALEQPQRKKLVVAWDFDQCLDKVVKGDYASRLGPFAKAIVLAYAEQTNAAVVELVSFSNRISDFYNDVVQPGKGERPNIKALATFQALIKDECEVTVDDEYQINGDELFARTFKLTGEAYDLKKKEKTSDFIKLHTNFVKLPDAKNEMMISILNKKTTPTDHVLFLDDKFENLSLDHLPAELKKRCAVLHFHATSIATLSATKRSLDEPAAFAINVLANNLGKDGWFAVGKAV